MNYSTITQFFFLIIAIAMVFTFTRPTLVSIRAIQDDIFLYADAKDKVSEFNNQLSNLLAKEQSFQRTDLHNLGIYLPTTIDTLAVMSDIEVIARTHHLVIFKLASGEETSSQSNVSLEVEYVEGDEIPVVEKTSSTDFELTVSGDYEDFKAMLVDLERNKYPLEVIKLQIGAVSVTQEAVVSEAGATESTYDLTLRTYAFDYAESRGQSEVVGEIPPAM